MKNLLKKTTFAVGLLLATPHALYGEQKCEADKAGIVTCVEVNTIVQVCNVQCAAGAHCDKVCVQTATGKVTGLASEGNSVGDVAHDFNVKKAINITNFSKALTVPVPAKGKYNIYSFTLTAGNDKGKQVYLAVRNEKLTPEVKAALGTGKDTLIAVWVNVGNHKSINKNKELKHEFVETAEISFSNNQNAPKELQFSLGTNGEIMGGGLNKDGSIGSFAISSDLHTTAGLLKTN